MQRKKIKSLNPAVGGNQKVDAVTIQLRLQQRDENPHSENTIRKDT